VFFFFCDYGNCKKFYIAQELEQLAAESKMNNIFFGKNWFWWVNIVWPSWSKQCTRNIYSWPGFTERA